MNNLFFRRPIPFLLIVFHLLLVSSIGFAQLSTPLTEKRWINPDGSSGYATYETRTIDGKKVEIKKFASREFVDERNGQRTKYDTVYRSDGVTADIIKLTRWSGEAQIYREEFTYSKDHYHSIKSGTKVEYGYDGKTRWFDYDPQKGDFKLEPSTVRDGNSVDDFPKITNCPIPKGIIGAGFNMTRIDDGGEKISMKGPELFFDLNFGSNPENKIRAGAGIYFASLTHKEDETKSTLTILTAGPEITFFYGNRFSTNIAAQAGTAKDVFKFGDYKEHENSFVIRLSARESVCVGKFVFGGSIGVLNTKFGDKSTTSTTASIFAALQLLGVF